MTVPKVTSDVKGRSLIVVSTPESEIGSQGGQLEHLQVVSHYYLIQEACEVQALEGKAPRVLREDLHYFVVQVGHSLVEGRLVPTI